MKYFYLKNLQNIQSSKQQYLYSYTPFKQKFEVIANYENILEIFNKNLNFLQTIISNLFERMFSFNNFCPKIIKYICNSIYCIIKEKYNYLDELTLFTFVNKFSFEITFIENLKYPERNELIANEKIFTEKTHLSLNLICQILRKISKFELFDTEDSSNLSLVVLNYFITQNIRNVHRIINDILNTQNEDIFFSQNDNEDVYHFNVH